MKIKTRELIGPALDWAVVRSIYPDTPNGDVIRKTVIKNGEVIVEHRYHDGEPLGAVIMKPSTSWAQGGPLIDSYKVDLRSGLAADNKTLCRSATVWVDIGESAKFGCCLGGTNLIAAMRAIVAAKLGDSVDVPAELCAVAGGDIVINTVKIQPPIGGVQWLPDSEGGEV